MSGKDELNFEVAFYHSGQTNMQNHTQSIENNLNPVSALH